MGLQLIIILPNMQDEQEKLNQYIEDLLTCESVLQVYAESLAKFPDTRSQASAKTLFRALSIVQVMAADTIYQWKMELLSNELAQRNK